MRTFLIKRLLNLILVMIIISFLLFGILKMMPGDPVQAYLGIGSKVDPQKIEEIKQKLGLYDSVPVQYARWLSRAITGDFGNSYKYSKPVIEAIGPFILNSFYLNLASTILAFAIAIPVGIRSGVKKYGLFDNAWTIFSMAGVSIPTFFFALLLIYFVAIGMKDILPIPLPISGMHDAAKHAFGYESKWEEIKDVLIHMILPVIVLTMTSLASIIRYVRNAVIDVINQDYIRTARSKGLRESVVIYKHAFRNALIPIVTLMGMYIPTLFAGAILLETVFNWPGIGNVLYESIRDRDYSMVMAVNVFYALLTVLGNLLADVSYALVDPRVKVE